MRPFARLAPVALAALATIAACTSDRSPTAAAPGNGSLRTVATTGPASVVATAPTFVFLPPIGTGQSIAPFDATRAPVVEVCRWTGTACELPMLASYTRVTVDLAADEYRVDWPTANLPAGSTYRIRVTLDGAELGGALARVPAAGETAAALRAQGYVVLGTASALPIRFSLGMPPVDGQLAGDPAGPAAVAIPYRLFTSRPQDVSDTHPQLPGVLMSFNTLMLVFQPATTVAQANAILGALGATIVGGIPGSATVPGLLMLRLPTTSHEQMEQQLGALRANPRVRVAVQDAVLESNETPAPNAGNPTDWTWEVAPTGGNWGLELIRTPQMWNLNRAICKELKAQAPTVPGACEDPTLFGNLIPTTGILDEGFVQVHEDLRFRQNLTPATEGIHGTKVAGIIGARYGNRIGVDGVNPFASLVVRGGTFPSVGADKFARAAHSGAEMMSRYFDLLRTNPGTRVINISLGYNWAEHLANARTNANAQRVANDQGAIVTAVQTIMTLVSRLSLPVVVVAGGNDSDSGYGQQDVRYNSPFANAAILGKQANVIVVEAVSNTPAAVGGATRAAFSNDGGHVSAPGVDVESTTLYPARYKSFSGTSASAPFVAGLVGYLFTLAPTLAPPTTLTNPVRDLLLAHAIPVAGGAAPRIDAFAAALGIDQAAGQPANRVLRKLLDVDDGTPDGNQRTILTAAGTKRDFTDADAGGRPGAAEDVDRDGGIGDGRVDMKDFRRWRDWLLQVENPAGLQLDGSASHPKKDLNGDGVVGTAARENVYPRGDFNGDGVISRTATRAVPGFAAPVTDLQVLQRLFVDPDVAAANLPNLINSADVAVDASVCMALDGAQTVSSRVDVMRVHARPAVGNRPAVADTVKVHTVPVTATGRTALVEARGRIRTEAGVLVDVHSVATRAITAAELGLGADVPWRAPCTPSIYVRVFHRPVSTTVVYAHFTGPTDAGPRFHISWHPCNDGPQNDLGSATAPPFAYVEYVDAPEINCTGSNVHLTHQRQGTYRFYVYDADRRASLTSDTLSLSNTVVQVYRGTRLLQEFPVPRQPGTLWTVFELDGDTLTPINTMRFEPNPANIEPAKP